MSETIIFVMDSELCPYCDAFLAYGDQWVECGWGWLWFDEESYEEEFGEGYDEDEDDPYTDFGDYDERAYLAGEYDEEA